MEFINQTFFDRNFEENKDDFSLNLFMHNNVCIMILAFYLAIEQFCYGYFLAQDNMLKDIHLLSAFVMGIYFIFAVYFYGRNIMYASLWLKAYELSFGLYGFASSILRALTIKSTIFAIPTVYIAVIYGFAVFFYFRPAKSFMIYSITCVCTILLLPIFKPEVLYNNYRYDIISNNVIAWIASCIGFRHFRKEFLNQKTIRKKNEMLQEKTIEIEKINKELHYNSTMDSLTNLYNRRWLNQLLEDEFIKCKKTGKMCSLILLDVDFFKSINDTYGHSVGDRVLVEVAELIKQSVRKEDTVGRWGGEEFLVICPETEFDILYQIAEQIRVRIENFDFRLKGKVTCCLGIATNRVSDTVLELVQKADRGLYRAKDKGRNRVEKGE